MPMNDVLAAPNREKIIQQTMDLLVKQGVHKTSLAEIAKAACISKGTLYYYFKSKEELIYAIVERSFDEITTSFNARFAASDRLQEPEEAIYLLLTSLLSDPRPGRLKIYLLEQAVHEENSEIRALVVKKFGEWQQMLVDFLAALVGRQDEQCNRRLASVILSTIDGLIVQNSLDPALVDLRSASQNLALMIRGSVMKSV